MEWYWILITILGAALIILLFSALFYILFFKRFWDIVLSGLAIIVLSPLLVVLIIVGAIAMRGNPFFTQERPGKKEKIFKLIKFRSMSNRRDSNGELLPDDQRLGKYGKIIRSTSLDELPELFNIFIGNMSIVGPRPLLIKYLPFYRGDEKKRHDVRPGLTGWAQINGRNFVDWDNRLKFDVEYVDNLTLWFDIKIIFLTVFKVLKRSGVAEKRITPLDVERKEQLKE